jgi:hypothetical protein
MEYTGMQNIYFYGTLMGFSKKEMDKKLDDIIAFAEIGDYIDQPVKTYSSGMFARLAFSCAIHIEPEILIVDEIQNVAISKNGRNLLGVLLQLINCSGVSICMVGTPECQDFFTQAMQLARRSLGLQYESMEYGEEFVDLCETLYQYQYVRNRTELDDATIRWLYEHSNGNVSSVVTLLHDAQEIGVMEGSEILNLETLNAAYKSRMKMLHSYIVPTRKPQTSSRKRSAAIPRGDRQLEDLISISALIQQAKSEDRDIVSFLKPYITIEEVRL